jgi:hypothetical protein
LAHHSAGVISLAGLNGRIGLSGAAVQLANAKVKVIAKDYSHCEAPSPSQYIDNELGGLGRVARALGVHSGGPLSTTVKTGQISVVVQFELAGHSCVVAFSSRNSERVLPSYFQ